MCRLIAVMHDGFLGFKRFDAGTLDQSLQMIGAKILEQTDAVLDETQGIHS
jgi:hypothetical protein